jgi:serine/threonine-protein kinase
MKTIKLPSGTFLYDPAKPLGKRGGFGQVFEGRTITGDVVAVKKLHVSAADAAHRELSIADELKGRSLKFVVPFIDSGEDADSGDYFVVMSQAEQSLQSFIEKNGIVSAEKSASILLQIVNGLSEVEDLVHRDLKPDNVLFHVGNWKIADFGIARFIQAVTSNNTLKEWLSDDYAAPEQWRGERATHATDIYALGCIAFSLLVGNPPFKADFAESHQRKSVPQFVCSDPRLKSLISMMLRKMPESRPVLSRVQQLLTEIIAKPQAGSLSDPFTILATAGAKVAERELQREAEERAAQDEQKRRNRLAQSAREILLENIERLWGKIHNNAPTARRFQGYQFYIELGDVALQFQVDNLGLANQDSSSRSGWDVIVASQINVMQRNPAFSWNSSLWYAKLRGKDEYRWYEVGYFSPKAQVPEIFAARSIHDADSAFVAGRSLSDILVAYGPLLIDDEAEDEFHSRIIWLLAKGANGQLRTPSRFPFNWPPMM